MGDDDEDDDDVVHRAGRRTLSSSVPACPSNDMYEFPGKMVESRISSGFLGPKVHLIDGVATDFLLG